jgi:hypothetical protein
MSRPVNPGRQRGSYGKIVGCLFIAFNITACLTDRENDLKAQIDASTMPHGWQVRCNYDQHRAENQCFAVKFVDQVPFKISYTNKKGPRVEPGHHSIPAFFPTVRVDNGSVRQATGNDIAIVEEMKQGKIAYGVYYVAGNGARRITVPLEGFVAAEERLRQLVLSDSR